MFKILRSFAIASLIFSSNGFSQESEDDDLLLLIPAIVASSQEKVLPEWGFFPDLACFRNGRVLPTELTARIDGVTDRVLLTEANDESAPFNGYRATSPGLKNVLFTVRVVSGAIDGCPDITANIPVRFNNKTRYLLFFDNAVFNNGELVPDLEVLSEEITGPADTTSTLIPDLLARNSQAVLSKESALFAKSINSDTGYYSIR